MTKLTQQLHDLTLISRLRGARQAPQLVDTARHSDDRAAACASTDFDSTTGRAQRMGSNLHHTPSFGDSGWGGLVNGHLPNLPPSPSLRPLPLDIDFTTARATTSLTGTACDNRTAASASTDFDSTTGRAQRAFSIILPHSVVVGGEVLSMAICRPCGLALSAHPH